jgi:tetratricopeptide (TPR) repeat protein
MRGLLYKELGRWEQSLADLKPCTAVHNDIWIHAALEDDYDVLAQVVSARAEAEEVERIVALYPESAEGYRALALALLVERKETEALVALEKAARLDPSRRGNSLWAQGVVFARLGRWQEAIAAMKGYLDRYPDQVLAHIHQAINYIEVGREDAAQEEVAEALRLDPQLSLDIGIKSVRRSGEDRLAVDLRNAGLK